MNYPQEIAEIEAELSRVLGMVEDDESAISRSKRPMVERIFLASSKKLRADLQKQLHMAKAERAHETIRLRFEGARFSTGTLPLRAIAKFLVPFNAALEQSAWRFWDREGISSKIDPKFIRQLDLRLAGLHMGSTELVILGNTAPDLSGVSALESSLRDLFDLLRSDIENFADCVHAIGTRAGKSMAEFLSRLESEHLSIDLEWKASNTTYRWEGRPTEITRVRSLLEEIGEPHSSNEQFTGTVNVLSIRNRIEIQNCSTGEKLRAGYHNSLAENVHDLRLGDKRLFQVERTVYPFVVSKRKRDTFRLVDVTEIPSRHTHPAN